MNPSNDGETTPLNSSNDEETTTLNPLNEKESVQGDASEESALENNIRTKGHNSYYYAHKKMGEKVEFNKDMQPRLLRKEIISKEKVGSNEIKKFAWSDEDKKVRIYIELPGIGAHPEENFELEWEPRQLDFLIKGYEGTNHRMKLRTYEEINDATLKRKPDRIILTLTKQVEMKWYSLKKDIS